MRPITTKPKVQKVAFVVGVFPATSETFIINQIADLMDRGISVHVFAFNKGNETHVTERYFKYAMRQHVTYISAPSTGVGRVCKGLLTFAKMLVHEPRAYAHIIQAIREHGVVHVLYTACWAYAFVGKKFDIVHCHFGTIATKYVRIQSLLKQSIKCITTFYGYDVSHTPKEKGMDCYKDLIMLCDKFLVMSENMKERVLPLGVPEDRIEVHPISIDVDTYKYHARNLGVGEKVRIVSVGRFVEKKGFDDLLRALKLVKQKAKNPFICSIVGDGELRDEIHGLAKELQVEDVLDFKGFMKLEDVLALYDNAHLYVQASKTARNGDME